MPLFFMLSGFSLTVAYGHKFPDPSKELEGQKPFAKKPYYWNRWIRTMPTYYLVNALAFVPAWFGFTGLPPFRLQTVWNSLIAQTIMTIIPVSTWMGPVWLPIDGPSWTISTLLGMWLIFPCSMRGIKKMTDKQLVNATIREYWIQLILVFVILFIFTVVAVVLENPKLGTLGFLVGTMSPFTRYPLFLMGMYAGELCQRSSEKNFPIELWPKSIIMGYCCCKNKPFESAEAEAKYWQRQATSISIVLLVITLLFSVFDKVLKVSGWSLGLLAGVWWQAIVPMLHLQVIIALTRDKGLSLASKALRTRLAQWLGKVSMAVYLVHMPVGQYLKWFFNKC